MGSEGERPRQLTGWLSRIVPAVLAVESYRRFWYTGLLYYQAHWMEITITGWVVLDFTGSAAAVGLVAFFRTLPMLIFGLIFGTLSDRFSRTGMLMLIQITGLFAAAMFSLVFLFGVERIWIICILSTLIGCAWAGDFATRRALVAELNPPENTGSAMSLESFSLQGGKILAPVIGGLMLGFGGVPAAYLFLTGMFSLGIVGLRQFRATGVVPRRTTSARLPILELIRTGWVTAIQIPIVRVVLIITVLMNLLVFPYQQLIALVAGEILDVGPGRMGILAGAAGLGSAVMAGFLTFRSRPATVRSYFAGGATLGAIGLVALAISTNFHASLVLQLAIGASVGAFGAMQAVIIASAVEPEMRARAMGLLAMAIGTSPIGILLVGVLSSWIGPAWTIGGMAGLAAILLGATIIHYRDVLSESEGAARSPTTVGVQAD